jgi:hypothetical protein
MVKIPTLFQRDESVRGHPVVNKVTPGCEWVLAGEGIATEKLDGTNVKIEGGQMFKRQKPKERDYDAAAYVPVDANDPADAWHIEAFDVDRPVPDGIYELIGPKVQGNPHRYPSHALVSVIPPAPRLWIEGAEDRSFYGLRAMLAHVPIEGIVFHHSDGRFAKIKRRDYGLPWPA